MNGNYLFQETGTTIKHTATLPRYKPVFHILKEAMPTTLELQFPYARGTRLLLDN
jgi:hypothetical protein